ncbi:MAG: hypothetical protein R3F49_13035 [Planctomycetota bacterium]
MNSNHDMHDEANEQPGSFLFLVALRKAAARPILWIATWAALFLLALAPAMATLAYMEGAFDNGTADWRTLRDAGASLTSETWTLSETFRQDNRAGLQVLSTTSARVLAALAAASMLLGVFAAGGWLQLAYERVDGRQFRRFCFGGAVYFWRFLRVLLLVALLLALVRWLCYGTPWKHLVLGKLMKVPEYDWGKLETLPSELLVARLGWAQDGLAALGFALVLVWGVYTRTRIAQRDARTAFGAGVATFFVMLRHPIQTLRPLLLLYGVQVLIVVVAAGRVVDNINERALAAPRLEHVVALLAVAQVAALWRHMNRGATYLAAARVSSYLVPPHKKKGNPWQSIGGPGGPQYPVGNDEDDYHVAL